MVFAAQKLGFDVPPSAAGTGCESPISPSLFSPLICKRLVVSPSRSGKSGISRSCSTGGKLVFLF